MTARYESSSNVTFFKGSEKLISLKFHVLKKASADKLHNGVGRSFSKNR